MTEQEVIDQLSRYRELQARIHVLSTYSVGAGITVSRLSQDDQLQDLHRRLRKLPTYMYLSGYEQKLEATAHAYLTRYPAGVRSQLQEIPRSGADAEDEKLLCELRRKIQKVIEARGYDVRDDIDAVLDRVAQLQDFQDEVGKVDAVMTAISRYKPECEVLLRRKYINGEPWDIVAADLQMSKATFFRYRDRAIREYIKIAG